MLCAVESIDLVEVVAQQLVRRATGGTGVPHSHRFVAGADWASLGELITVEDLHTGRVCLMPAPSLQMISLAGLAGLTARELLRPGEVTSAVFGSAALVCLYLTVIARYVPHVSHIAVYPAVSAEDARSASSTVGHALARADIGVSGAPDARSAAQGANLVVVAELGLERLDVGPLRPGVLVVNAAHRDMPDELLSQVDRVYVDDLELIEHNQQRAFVRLHLADQRPPAVADQQEGWHRHRPLWRDQQRISADLGRVLVGTEGRPGTDDVILAELLGGARDVWLASHIHRTAIDLGIGWQERV
jgi:ornithine cyclodeaminase/alanine dehydrogenase-like protein (mu-crystallin family)